jgi:hypothetical protein
MRKGGSSNPFAPKAALPMLGRSASFVEDMGFTPPAAATDEDKEGAVFYHEAKTSLRALILTAPSAEKKSFDFASGTERKRQRVTADAALGANEDVSGGESDDASFYVEVTSLEAPPSARAAEGEGRAFVATGRSDSFAEDDVALPPVPFLSPASGFTRIPKKPAEEEEAQQTSRFQQDFLMVETIGSGQFGRVLRCRSRLDGCEYAVKSMKNRFRGVHERASALREVHALAHLGASADTPHIVRYHQAWIEDERLFIQMELCEISLEQVRPSPPLCLFACFLSVVLIVDCILCPCAPVPRLACLRLCTRV